MALVLSLVSSLFILLSWGACFITGPWHHVVVVTLVLSLASSLIYSCHEVFVLSLALDTMLLWWRLFYPCLQLIYSFFMRHLLYLWSLSYCCGNACFVSGLQLIYSFVIRCLFYLWPLTPCCCDDICLISGLQLIYSLVMRRLFYPWPLTSYFCGDACFIHGLQLIYSFVMWCLFYLRPLTSCYCGDACLISVCGLFILLSWGACFVSSP